MAAPAIPPSAPFRLTQSASDAATAAGVVFADGVARGYSTARRITQGLCIASGDSRIAASFAPNGKATLGFPCWIEQLSAGALTFTPSAVFALGGITTATYVATYLPSVITHPAPTSFVMIGVNSAAQDVPFDQAKSHIDTIVRSHKRVGKTLILCNDYLPMPSHPQFTPARLAYQAALSAYIDTKHDPANGVYVPNTRDAMAQDPLNYTDLLHPTSRGAARCAAAIVAAVQGSFVSRTSLLARPSPTYNPNSFAGWGKPSGTGVTVTEVSDGGISVLTITYKDVAPASPAATLFIMAGVGSIPAGFTPGTSRVDACIGYELDAGHTNLGAITFQVFGGSSALVAEDGGATALDGFNGGASTSTPYPDGPLAGVFHPLVAPLPSGATTVQPFVIVNNGKTGGLINFTLRLFLPQLRAL